ncbi:polysaccharide deacetylase family protein [Gorillibacterium massiliense]|uniref:polysaccharide deacetylase family protein n=1 Tax=Gorillibacterium massiliense TaxID=1280390 RepID=UPI0004B9C159|nr:polysaccharide deacetylase family protein [Gorillibacterium massiliense]
MSETLPVIIDRVQTHQKAVAITFDDGPNPIYTPQILEIFREAGGKATFFIQGSNLEKYPDVAAAIHEQGHELGNHTYSHPAMTEVSEEQRIEELQKTEELIFQTTGGKPAVFRPPYFNCNDDVARLCGRYGYAMIGAVNGDARDWEMPGTDFILEKTLPRLAEGSVLIFHDGYDDRSQTVEAIRQLVPRLTAEGYRLVTVSELLKLAENGQACPPDDSL